ncbi:metallo-beta-lactamase [Lactiplantibacillus xiangfangensis]|uniref:Metallo-beta-lactamase n=1 Tax=Lactiplantibacillus xiangfangensis TaxID=942150 RepID=A0A0R2ME73_9LACO|nr:metallo-beta-lactamase [Lactiplantibacillus xiangfangensis]
MVLVKLTVLGYYGGYPYDGVGTSSYLVTAGDYHLLLDCGSGALNALEEILDPLQLDAVLLSHYHHDHTADVGVLQYYWQLRQGARKTPELPIYGHTADPLNFGALTWAGATVGRAYDPAVVNPIGPFDVSFMPTKHPVPAYAVKIVERATGEQLTFSADTAYIPRLADFAQGSQLLMTDTNFGAAKTGKMWHMTSTQSGEIAKAAHAKRLLLTHLPQDVPFDQLRDEAQVAAGDGVQVIVAQKYLQLDLG